MTPARVEVEGALRLWWDAVSALEPRVTREETWTEGVLYLLSNRVYGSEVTQAEFGERLGISAASVGARARDIDKALNVAPTDSRDR